MILGIGIDMAKVSRFRSFLDKPHFLNKYFHQDEIEYVKSRGAGAAQSLAGKFAAREAFFKALGTGFSGFSPKDISVFNADNGRPYIIPGNRVKQELDSMAENCTIHLSISHEKEYAIAQVILEA